MVDTSAFIALFYEKDVFHDKAIDWWKKNIGKNLVTTNMVIMETISWIRYKSGIDEAVEVGSLLYASADLRRIRIGQKDEEVGFKLFKKCQSRGVSMVDATCFSVMKRMGIDKYFGFDDDFTKQGFESVV